MTNGLVRFTTDDRFNVLYKEGSFNWILQVWYINTVTCKYEVLKVVFFLSRYRHLLGKIIFSISILEHPYCFQIKFAQDRDAGIYECQVSTSTTPVLPVIQLQPLCSFSLPEVSLSLQKVCHVLITFIYWVNISPIHQTNCWKLTSIKRHCSALRHTDTQFF